MGSGDISHAIWVERNVGIAKHGAASRMHLNLERLGYSESLLEQNGIGISPPATTQPYYDTSTNPPTQGRLDHTKTGPNKHQHVPVEDARNTAPARDEPSPGEPSASIRMGSAAHSARDYGDLRQATHPGHSAYTHAFDCVRRMELAAGIAEGPGRERLAAAVAETVQREGMQLQRVELGANGQVFAVERGPYPEFKERRAGIDSTQALASSVEQTSERWLEARSPHYVAATSMRDSTPSNEPALTTMSAQDRALIARIRQDTPATVSDEHIAQVALRAKESGISDPGKLQSVTMVGDTLFVRGNTPGFRALVDVNAPAPSLQETAGQSKAFDQQREQAVAQDLAMEPERSRAQSMSRQLG